MNDVRNGLSAIAWICGLLLVQLALHRLDGAFPLPDFSITGLHAWMMQTSPTVLVFTIIRVGAILVIWASLATTALHVVAHATRSRRITRLAQSIPFPGTRALAIRLAGITALTSLAMPVNATQATSMSEVPTLHHLLPDETTPTPLSPTPDVQPAPLPLMNDNLLQHTVQRGENFWTIAEAHLRTVRQREPSEPEIVDYWRALVRTNHQVLANTQNPDLLFAGQVIELPNLG